MLPHDGFLGGVAEEKRRVIKDHEVDTGIIGCGEEMAGFLFHRELVAAILDEIFQRDRAEKQNYFWLHQFNLPAQVGEAGFDLLRAWRSVDLGLAFHDVDDEQVAVGVEADAGHDLVEQLPGASDERLAAHILVVAGAFADDEDFGIRVAAVDDDVVARLAAWTFLAVVGGETLAELAVTRCRQHVVVR